MKQYIRYSIVLLLTTLLHSTAIKGANSLHAPEYHEDDCYLLSQTSTEQHALQNLYDHFISTSRCIEHVDTAQVPGNKCFLLRINLFKMQLQAHSSECNQLPCSSPNSISGHTYYVFGLRKILI